MQVTTWARKKIKSFAKDLLTLHADAFQPPHAGASCCCKRAFLCLHCAEHKVLLCSSSPTVLGAWQLLRGQTSLQTACWITGVITYPKNHAVDFISLRKKRKKTHKNQEVQKKKSPLWVQVKCTQCTWSQHWKRALFCIEVGNSPQKEMAVLCCDMLLLWAWPSQWGMWGLSPLLKGLFVCLFVESG